MNKSLKKHSANQITKHGIQHATAINIPIKTNNIIQLWMCLHKNSRHTYTLNSDKKNKSTSCLR